MFYDLRKSLRYLQTKRDGTLNRGGKKQRTKTKTNLLANERHRYNNNSSRKKDVRKILEMLITEVAAFLLDHSKANG